MARRRQRRLVAEGFSHAGKYYRTEDTVLEPKPLRTPRPPIYAGGESEAAKNLIAQKCDAYVMHGDSPAHVAAKIADMSERREKLGLGRMQFGVSGYAFTRNTEREVEASSRALPTSSRTPRATRTISSGCRERSSSRACRSRSIPCRTADCGRAWWALRRKYRSRSAGSRRRVSICCCCNSARNSKRWKYSAPASCGNGV